MFCSEDSLFGSRGWCRGWGDPSGVHGVTHIFRNTQSAIYNWYIQCSAHATTYMKNILIEGLAQVQTWRWDRAVLSFTIAHFRGFWARNFHPIFIHFTPHARTEIRQNFAKYRQKYWGILWGSEQLHEVEEEFKNFPVSKKITNSLSVLHINPLS